MAKVPVQVTIDKDLVDRMDKYAEDQHINRSALVSVSVSQFLTAFDVKQALFSLTEALTKIADNGKIDEDTQRQLEDFARVARLLSATK